MLKHYLKYNYFNGSFSFMFFKHKFEKDIILATEPQSGRHIFMFLSAYLSPTAMVLFLPYLINVTSSAPLIHLHAKQIAALRYSRSSFMEKINPLNPELNPICYLLALLEAHHFLHVSRIRVKLLTFRLLMSYIYMDHPFLMFLDHTRRRSTVGRTPLDE